MAVFGALGNEAVVAEDLLRHASQIRCVGHLNNGHSALGDVADVVAGGPAHEALAAIGSSAKAFSVSNIESAAVAAHRHSSRKPAGGNISQHAVIANIENRDGVDSRAGNVKPRLVGT